MIIVTITFFCMTKRKGTKEKSSAAFSALPKIAVAGEGLGNLGILEELGKLESIIGNIIIVPNVENVENSLSGI